MTVAPDILQPGFFCSPTRISFGPGTRRGIAPLIKKLRFAHAALVTDAFFEQHSPHVAELVQSLATHGIACTVYAGGLPDPSLALCDEATAALQATLARRIDCVIALGGGSNIDLAKVLCVTLPGGAPAETYVGLKAFPVTPLPLIAIPTTAGTASEITPGAILVKDAHSPKVAVMGNDLRALVAVVDPELTLSCPPRVTADAGMDALTHAIESYVTLDAAQFDREGDPDPGYSGRNLITRMFARESIVLGLRHLRRAVTHGDDLEARAGMCMSSLYAGLSYASAGLNAVHALAYGLTAVTHETHGRTNAVLLPYAMDALLPLRPAELADIAAIARAEGADAGHRAAPAMLRQLVADIGIPANLREFGVAEDALGRIIDGGLAVTRLVKAWPGPDAASTFRRIVHNAHAGTLSG
jgi:alcohol dehydrogenase